MATNADRRQLVPSFRVLMNRASFSPWRGFLGRRKEIIGADFWFLSFFGLRYEHYLISLLSLTFDARIPPIAMQLLCTLTLYGKTYLRQVWCPEAPLNESGPSSLTRDKRN